MVRRRLEYGTVTVMVTLRRRYCNGIVMLIQTKIQFIGPLAYSSKKYSKYGREILVNVTRVLKKITTVSATMTRSRNSLYFVYLSLRRGCKSEENVE